MTEPSEEEETVVTRVSLLDLEPGLIARVSDLQGGKGFRRRLETRGIIAGKEIRVITKQPAGPIVVGIGSLTMTLGRGMARKIFVEVEE